MRKLLTKLFGDPNEAPLKPYQQVIGKVNALEPQMEALSDLELRELANGLRDRLEEGETLDDLLPVAVECHTSVVVGGAFNSGLLADPGPHSTYNYTQAPPELLDRALRMKSLADRHGITLRAAALAFCAAHPAVASVLVGVRSADEVRDCAEQFATEVPMAFWQELLESGLLSDKEPR